MSVFLFFKRFYPIVSLLLLSTYTFNTNAQSNADSNSDDTYYDEDRIKHENYIYKEGIKTVQLFRKGWETSYPLINLNSGETMQLSFDDLSGAVVNYGYTFIHCNANWEPSDLDKFDYLEGMREDVITDVSYSMDTRQKYIHYDLTFPNSNIQLTKSGNYILKVFDQDDENKPVITWRFFIADQLVSVIPDIKRSTRAQDAFYQHEVDFKIFQSNYTITNPYSDLKVVILQNQRWDNAIKNIKPTFAKGKELVYDNDLENTFNAGNEFRFFDIRDVYYRALRTQKIVLENDTFNAYINKDAVRSIRNYEDQPDINGRFFIKDDDPRNNRVLDGEYVKVHLSLPYPYPLKKGDLYIFGELSQWKSNKKYKLYYNEKLRQYEINLYVKQGYYNYTYLYFEDGKPKGDVSLIEGTHSQTSNEYTILAYHRKVGDNYDQLIGVRTEVFPQR